MKKIQQMRQQLGSVKEVSRDMFDNQIDHKRLRDIETGRRRPRPDEQELIANKFGSTIAELFDHDGTPLDVGATRKPAPNTDVVDPIPPVRHTVPRAGYGTDARLAADAVTQTHVTH